MARFRKFLTSVVLLSIFIILLEDYLIVKSLFPVKFYLPNFEKSCIDCIQTKPLILAHLTSTQSSLINNVDTATKITNGSLIVIMEKEVLVDTIEDNQDSQGKEVKSSFDEEYERLKSSPYIYDQELEAQRYTVPVIEGPTKSIVVFLNPLENSRGAEIFRQCRYKKCEMISNTQEADAVVFIAAIIRDNIISHVNRPEGQRWVMLTYDPPEKNYKLERKDVGSNFNWTITYQLDADIIFLYGRLQKQEPPLKDYDKIFESKTKHIAWFVSHCPTWSKREIYVSRMRKILGVDIFGRCGNLTCGIHLYGVNDSTLCMPMLTRNYKFYLSFENALCKDYITEKFFKMFIDVDVIPVVRGGFDYKRYLPSNTFIDASDFKSPEDLASYLQVLGSDKARYTQMLREKNKWRAIPEVTWYCHLCEALHTTTQTNHYHKNLHLKYHGNPSYCRKPTDL